MGFFLLAASGGYSLVAVRRLLLVVACLGAEHGRAPGACAAVVAARGLRSYGSRALRAQAL